MRTFALCGKKSVIPGMSEQWPEDYVAGTAVIFWPGGDRVTHMAETDLENPNVPPAVLVTQIENTRADLARTIDEIADRVLPANVARRATDRVREKISQIDPLVGGAVALAVVSVTCFIVWRRLRR
jgi:Protein of unknown function (DUF3618)